MVEVQGVLNFAKLKIAAIELKENRVINPAKDENSMYKIVLDNLLNKEPQKPEETTNTAPVKKEPNQEQIARKLPIKQNANIKELNWSEADVEKWCMEKKIHPNIELHLKPCNGQLLYEFFLIKIESPDFFYRSLAINKSNSKPVLIRDVAIFSLELKKIFCN